MVNEEPRLGLRERKKAEVYRALASAALHLADEQGLERVTVEAIADAAGVSPRTFFNYFRSKEEAIVGITPAQSAVVLDELLARPENEPPLDALREVIRAAARRVQAAGDDWVIKHRLIHQHVSLSLAHAAWFASVERRMTEEIARRAGVEAGAHVYPGVAVTATLAALRVAIDVWQQSGGDRSLDSLVDEAFEVFAHGLQMPPTIPPRARSRRSQHQDG